MARRIVPIPGPLYAANRCTAGLGRGSVTTALAVIIFMYMFAVWMCVWLTVAIIAVPVAFIRWCVEANGGGGRPAPLATRTPTAPPLPNGLTIHPAVADFRARDADHNGLPHTAAVWLELGGLPGEPPEVDRGVFRDAMRDAARRSDAS